MRYKKLRPSFCSDAAVIVPSLSRTWPAIPRLRKLTSEAPSYELIYGRREDADYSSKHDLDKRTFKDPVPAYAANQKVQEVLSCWLEVISGRPSCGLQYSVQSTNTSKLPVTIGRVVRGNILLKDSEVSGKHAMINWNASNGTLMDHNLKME